jgi:hypothetical protein
MITNTGGCYSCEFAQTGWARIQSWGTNTFFFYECANSDSGECSPGLSIYPQQLGMMQNPLDRSYNDLATVFESTAGMVYFSINPTYDPNGTTLTAAAGPINWDVNKLQAIGEVQNQETQTTGTTGSYNYFLDTQFLRSGTWTDANFNNDWTPQSDKYGQYEAASTGPTDSFYLWDSRY